MNRHWRCALGAAVIALGAQSALAQKMNGCPAGEAMQSSDPSGKSVTCVPIPDTSALQQQITNEAAARQAMDANILNMLGAETAARQAADNALGARIDALTEADIVGKWSVSGPTSCLQSNRGFDANFSPVVITGQPTIVTQLTATSIGTRTFNADGTGTAAGNTQAMTHAGVIVGVLGTDGAGSANVSGFTNQPFTWHIQSDGKLFIDDAGPIVQVASAPASRKDWTFTIDRLPPFEGYISKDKKTIVMTHPVMQMETSTTLDQNGTPPPNSSPTPRFCARHRVLTRLPD
jgi:hypothetical protein